MRRRKSMKANQKVRPTIEDLDFAHALVDVLAAKKGEDIVLLDLMGVCSFTDYFVLCTGASERTVKALADDLALQAKRSLERPAYAIEGRAESGWVLMDFGGVVVHIFSDATRRYYALESLWAEGRRLLHIR